MKGKIYKLLPQAKILNLHLLPSQKGLFRGQVSSINDGPSAQIFPVRSAENFKWVRSENPAGVGPQNFKTGGSNLP